MAAEMSEQDADDPEIREMERQSVYLAAKHNSGGAPEKKAEDEEAYKQELDELGSDDEDEDAKGQLEKIDHEIGRCIAEAEKAKREQDMAELSKLLEEGGRLKKAKEELLAKHPELKSEGKAKQEDTKKAAAEPSKAAEEEQKIVAPKLGDLSKLTFDEIEEKFHNTERMASVLVLMEELALMDKKIASLASADEKSYYQDRKEALNFKKTMIEQGINGDQISPEKYTHDIAAELKFELTLLAGFKATNASPEDVRRVEKRIELIKTEQQGMITGEEEPAAGVKVESSPATAPPAAETDVSKAKTVPEEEKKKEAPKREKAQQEEETPELKKQKSFDPNDIVEGEVDLSKADKKQYELVSSRINEYRKAAEYLLNNGLMQQGQSVIGKIDNLKSSLAVIAQGKKVDTLKLEAPLNPETMFGLTHDKRIKALQEIAGHLQKLLTSHNNAAQQAFRGAKKDKSLAKTHLLKAQEADRWISYMKAAMSNAWLPLPAYHFDTVIEETQVLQKDVPANILMLEYIPDPRMLKKKYYNIEYELNNGHSNVEGKFDAYDKSKVKIRFPDGTKQIHEAELSLKLIGRLYLFLSPTRAEAHVKLSALESQTVMSIPFNEERGKYKLSVTVRVRVPSNGKSTIESEHQEIVIDRAYPSFIEPKRVLAPQHTRSAAPAPPTAKSEVAARPVAHKKPAVGAQSVAAPKPRAGDPPLPKVLENLPPRVREIDVRDPDDIGNLTCASYLQTKIATYTAEIKKRGAAGQKIPEQMSKKLGLMTRNHAAITGQIDSGKLTPDMYRKFLEAQYEKDKGLYVYLEKLGQKSRMGVVRERIQCIAKELKSLS